MTIKKEPHFDGETYDSILDHKRLTGQYKKVFEVMKDGVFRTLDEIQQAMADTASQPSISARLRDFRKNKFGAHTVHRKRRKHPTRGIFEYSLHLRGCVCKSCIESLD